MFFTPELLQRRDSGFGLIWLAATLGSKSALRKLPRKGILSADIPQLCEMISSPPEPLALRLSANLMVGVARVYHARHDMWANDVTNTFTNLKKAINAMYMENGAITLEMAQGTVRPDAITLPVAGDRASMEFDFAFDFNLNFDLGIGDKEWQLPVAASPDIQQNAARITLDESHIFDGDISRANDYEFDFDFDFGGPAGGPSSSAAPRSAQAGGGHATSSAGNEPFHSDLGAGLGAGAVGDDGRIDLGLGLEDDGWGAVQGWGGADAGNGVQIDLGLDDNLMMMDGEVPPGTPSTHLSSAIRKDMTAAQRRKPRNLLADDDFQPGDRQRTPSLTHSQESPPSADELDAIPPGGKRPGDEVEGGKKKKKRVRLLLDTRTELTDAELVANREDYHEMMLAARAEALGKAPQPWVADLLYKDMPDWLAAPELRECFANVIEANAEARKRRWEDNDVEDGRAVRRRLDEGQEVERGRGGRIVYPDDELQAPGWEQPYDEMNLFEDDQPRAGSLRGILRPSLPGSVEQGRGASILHDISQKSTAFPWDNVEIEGHRSSSWAPFNSVDGGPSSGGMIGMFSPRPNGSASGLRLSRGSREGSLVPPDLPGTPRLSLSGVAGPLEDYVPFPEASGHTQTQTQTQSQSQDAESLATLERNSFNFLEYIKAEHNVAQQGLPPGAEVPIITLAGVLPAYAKTRHVAANAFYNCLVLATKSFIRLDQPVPYGEIAISIL